MGGRQFKPNTNKGKHPMYLIYNERKPSIPRTCPNCHKEFKEGESGHMVPPCFGDRAMWICNGDLPAGVEIPE